MREKGRRTYHSAATRSAPLPLRVCTELTRPSLTGTLSPTGHHLHMSISDRDCRTYGGHVLEGCIVRTTAELVLAEVMKSEQAEMASMAELVDDEVVESIADQMSDMLDDEVVAALSQHMTQDHLG